MYWYHELEKKISGARFAKFLFDNGSVYLLEVPAEPHEADILDQLTRQYRRKQVKTRRSTQYELECVVYVHYRMVGPSWNRYHVDRILFRNFHEDSDGHHFNTNVQVLAHVKLQGQCDRRYPTNHFPVVTLVKSEKRVFISF